MRRQLMSPSSRLSCLSSELVAAANYVKVHAFLARGTCLPTLLSFSPSFSPLFLSPLARLFRISIAHTISLEIACLISREYHIRPRLRARFSSALSRALSRWIVISKRKGDSVSVSAPRCIAARVGERFCVCTAVSRLGRGSRRLCKE